MEKHRASWKAEFWMRRKGHSLDRVQGSKKIPGTRNSQSPRRASSERVRPLDRQASLDRDASVAPKLEKTKGATREQNGQRTNHKDKAHQKNQHRWLKTLVNFLTNTGSEEQNERGEKKSKEKCYSPQDPKYLGACVEPSEPTFKKKGKDKKSKEKGIFPEGPEPLEALTEPPEPVSKKKDRKASLKKAFSFKKHGNEEAKKSPSPETRRPAKPTFLPLCISHRPASLEIPDSDAEMIERWFTEVRPPDSTERSNQVGRPPPKEDLPLKRDSESKDFIIQKIVAVLREQGDRYNEKIKEDPCFKEAWSSLSFTSIQTLIDQEENQKEPEGSQVDRCCHITNKFTGNTKHAVHRIMGWRDHPVMPTFGHIPYNNEQHGTTTPFLSPD